MQPRSPSCGPSFDLEFTEEQRRLIDQRLEDHRRDPRHQSRRRRSVPPTPQPSYLLRKFNGSPGHSQGTETSLPVLESVI
jgi:hypothetical protein